MVNKVRIKVFYFLLKDLLSVVGRELAFFLSDKIRSVDLFCLLANYPIPI